jgi:hypothetical protein
MPQFVKHDAKGNIEAICITDDSDPTTEPFGPTEPTTHIFHTQLSIAAELETVKAQDLRKYIVDLQNNVVIPKPPGR